MMEYCKIKKRMCGILYTGIHYLNKNLVFEYHVKANHICDHVTFLKISIKLVVMMIAVACNDNNREFSYNFINV